MKLFYIILFAVLPAVLSFGPLLDFEPPRFEIEKPWQYPVGDRDFNK